MKNKVSGKTTGVAKGAPSGFVVSLLVHAAAFALAGLLVVFTVIDKPEKTFKPVETVKRPKMKLKKPKVKIKKSAKPKPTTRIVTKVQKATMPDIQLPEMTGMGEGMVSGIGGFDLMPDLGEANVFGNKQSIGNDFEGEVYSLLHDRRGGSISMDQDEFRDILRKYVLSGWKSSVLGRFYRTPEKRYTTHIMVPPIPTAMAPGVFGVPEMEDYYLFIKYEGQLVYPEDIKFRFWGMGDAYIFVNVDGKEVLVNGWDTHTANYFNWWTSTAAGSGSHYLGNMLMVVGDWIELKAGEPVDMKVLFGEWLGGQVAGMLLVEVEGVDYPSSRYGGPLLPAFKTEEFSWDTLTEIARFLPEDECSLTDGPVFNDFGVAKKTTETNDTETVANTETEPQPEEPEEPVVEESKVRLWTFVDGHTEEAELTTVMGKQAVFKNGKGRQIKVPLERLSKDDLSYIWLSTPPDLDINFQKTSELRQFGETYNAGAPGASGTIRTFGTTIEQTSSRPYGFGLTAEFFAIGSEVGGNKRILLDYQKADFTLTKDKKFKFRFSGSPVELLTYEINSEKRGKRYDTFLVVITDERGEIIAYKTPSEGLFRNLEALRKLKVGWYFDRDAKRCLPSRPRSWN